jgi:dTDP-D-glucose 4,6-dehydratase
VTDHCSAIRRILEAGRVGEVYNVGGWNEMANIDIVHAVSPCWMNAGQTRAAAMRG